MTTGFASCRWRTAVAAALLVVGLGLGCVGDDPSPGTTQQAATAEFDGDPAHQWVQQVLQRIEADAISPPVASRILGYTGLTMYEASVDGMDDHQSLGGQINGLGAPPELADDQHYDAPTVLHAALGHLVPVVFGDETSRNHLQDFAEDRLEQRLDEIDDAVWTDSANRGVLIAEIIASRAGSDGFYARTDLEFSPPRSRGSWEPVEPGQQLLEPNWASLEPFVLAEPDACRPAPPAGYSSRTGSEFYHQAMAVVDATPEPETDPHHIARFWADDPGETSTPPGHWMAIAGQMVEDHDLDLATTAELFGLLGITMADAFISCWDEKYRSFLLRPVTYINEHIDEDWEPTITTPPFPEYTSGHASVSGASAKVLTELLGEVSFEDRTHEDRGLGTRMFDDFWDAAREAGQSRIYGGVHYPMANDEGLDQGRCVADRVLNDLDLEAH